MMSKGACEPYLEMVIKPETKTRFRYESEVGSHGGLMGRDKVDGKKTYPTVKLENYSAPSKGIFVRVSLYTEKRTEHVLTFKKKKSSERPNYIDQNLSEDYTAEFKSLTILRKKKEDVYQALMERRFKMLGKNSKHARDLCEKESQGAVKEEAKEILNTVILRFDAFEHCRPDVQICPPLYSDKICNQKTSSKGDLKICRMSKYSGSWRGQDEVILLCDKVQKDNIKILFYEKDVEDGWKAYATFNPADVHYQVAIPFKTPAYKENVEKEVSVVLERLDEFSEPRPFNYIPDDYPSKKRKMDFSENLSSPMAISSVGSSTAVSEDSSQEFFNSTGANVIQESENDFAVPNNTSWDNLANNTDLDVMLGLSPLEMLERIEPLSYLLNENDNNMETTEEYQNDNSIQSSEDYQRFLSFLSSSGIESDGLPIGQQRSEELMPVKQMAAMKLQDSKPDFDIPRPLYMKQSRSVVSSENQREKLKKYLPFISKQDNNGNTLLHSAVLHNKNISIPIRMNEMANSDIINVKNFCGQTAVHIAVEKNPDVVRDLLISGSDPNVKNADGNNCYHIASLNNLDKCMKDLLTYSKFPHEVNKFNNEGLTPLHIAIMKNSSACFDILRRHREIDLRAKEKKCDRSLLHYAVEYHPSFIIPILKEGKNDVNIQDSEGNTPLHIACAAGDYDTVKQLLLYNADPCVKNLKKKYPDSEEENSDDENETPVGLTPADLTTDLRILELLKQASNKHRSGSTDSTDNSGFEAHLCKLLDSGGRLEEVAIYVLDEKYLDSLKWSSSPTRTLLEYMKRQSSEDYMETFKNALQMAGFDDAVQMITENYHH